MRVSTSLMLWLCIILLCASQFTRSFALEDTEHVFSSRSISHQEGTNDAKMTGDEGSDMKFMASVKKVGGTHSAGGSNTVHPKSGHKNDATVLLHKPCVCGFSLVLVALRFLFV